MKGLRAARGKDRETDREDRRHSRGGASGAGVQSAFVELLFKKNGEIFGDILIPHSPQSEGKGRNSKENNFIAVTLIENLKYNHDPTSRLPLDTEEASPPGLHIS